MLGQLSVRIFMYECVLASIADLLSRTTAPYLIIVRSEARRTAALISASKATTEGALRDLPVSRRRPPLKKSISTLNLRLDVIAPGALLAEIDCRTEWLAP